MPDGKDADKPGEIQTAAGKKLISIAALARRWSVSDTTIKRLIEEGELEGIKIRRSYRVFVDSVAAYERRSKF